MQNSYQPHILNLSSKKKPWSISQLNLTVKNTLGEFPSLWIVGEISNLVKANSGHCYFSLKDEKAQVSCAWFKGQHSAYANQLKNGLSVCVLAKPTLYEPRGSYQLIVSTAEAVGDGALHLAFNELKKKLSAEGLFNQTRSLPKYPATIGVVTSATGAAIKDIAAVLSRRYPLAKIIVYPAVVQGISAAKSITSALEKAISHNMADVLILARGGGAYEDLIGFNDEALARLIVKSPIPTITGIGHEIDFTIADFAADYRAATPSAAAEKASPNTADLVEHLELLKHQLQLKTKKTLIELSAKLTELAHRCKHPSHTLATQQQTLDHLEIQLTKSMQTILQKKQHELSIKEQHLHRFSLQKHLEERTNKLLLYRQRSSAAINLSVQSFNLKISNFANKLDGISPLKTLARGFAVVTNDKEEVILSKDQVSIKETVKIQLHQGLIKATINSKD